MSLPDPFDFRDSNSDGSEGESTSHDLLELFYSTEHRRLLRDDPIHQDKDRRLKFMRQYCENDSDGKVTEDCATTSKRFDSNSNLKFLGEQLVSSENSMNDPVVRMEILTTETVRHPCSSGKSWENTTIPSCAGPAGSEPGLGSPNLTTRHHMPRSHFLTRALGEKSQNFCIIVDGKVPHSLPMGPLPITSMLVSPLVDWTTHSIGEPHSFEWYVYTIPAFTFSF